MSLRIYFKAQDVQRIGADENQRAGFVGDLAVREDLSGFFYTDVVRIVDVLARTFPLFILAKISHASIKENWVGDALRQPGEYQNGAAIISVAYHETDRWAANNTVNGSSKDLLELIELYQAICVGNGQRFLRLDYGKPQGGPTYDELTLQLRDAKERNRRLTDERDALERRATFMRELFGQICHELAESLFVGSTKRLILATARSDDARECYPALETNVDNIFK